MYTAADPILTALAYDAINAKIKNGIFWECNLDVQDANTFPCKNNFRKDVLKCWSEYNYKNDLEEEEIPNQVIWYNSHIRIGNRVMYIHKPYEKGIIYLKDICLDNKIMTYEEMSTIYGDCMQRLEYYSLVHAIPKNWKNSIKCISSEIECEIKFCSLMEKAKWSRIIYNVFNYNEDGLKRLKKIWNKFFLNLDEDFFKRVCVNINKCTKIVKYRSFQYRLLNNIIYLNDRLKYFGIAENENCSWCKVKKETVIHAFYECDVITSFRNKIFENLKDQIDNEASINEENVIFNKIHPKPEWFENLLILLIKQHEFMKKCLNKNLDIRAVVTELEFIHKIEYKNAIISGKYEYYNSRWPDVIENVNNVNENSNEITDYILQMPEY